MLNLLVGISIRCVVPNFIVEQFGLKVGDFLDWELRVVDGVLCIIVTPVKSVVER